MPQAGFNGAGRFQDGVYDRQSPWQPDALRFKKGADFSSNEERLTSQALASALASSSLIRAAAPQPTLPRLTGQPRQEIGIRDVVRMSRRGMPDSGDRFSGSRGAWSGTSTPSMGWW